MQITKSFARVALLASSVVAQFGNAADAPRAYDLVVAGQKCSSSRNQIECNYRIGNSLMVNIAGVGLPEVAITTYQANDKGDFYASVGMLHGCVIVKPGEQTPIEGWMNLAFISPKNGKVYRDWRSCQTAE